MRDVVIDTHAWVWWIGGPGASKLGKKALTALINASTIYLSSASQIEVAWLTASGRLRVDREPDVWIKQALDRPKLEVVAISPDIAVRAACLKWAHRDPNDRVIVSTALELGLPLVTKDAIIRQSELVETLW